MMSSVSIPLNELISLISGNRISAYCDVAALVVLGYDFLTTFSEEVNLVWGTPWGLSRILYILTRYSPWIDAMLFGSLHFIKSDKLTPTKCYQIYQAAGWFIVFGGYLAEIIFLIRTYALWGRNKKILFGLSIFLVLSAAPALYLTYKGISTVFFLHFARTSCVLVQKNLANRAILWDFAFMVLFETTILGFTVVPSIRKRNLPQSNLRTTLYRDGLSYYFLLTMFSVGNLVLLAVGLPGVTLVLIQRVMHSVLTTRILLHIRRAGAKDSKASFHHEAVSWNIGVFSSVLISSEGQIDDLEC